MSIQRLAKYLHCIFLLASLSLIALVSGYSSRVVHAEMKHLLRGMVADHTGAAIPNFKVGYGLDRARALCASLRWGV
jgi:hypothetical protein